MIKTPKNNSKNFIIWIAVFIALMSIFSLFQSDLSNDNNLPLSDLLDSINGNNISEVKIQGRRVYGAMNDGTKFITYLGDYHGIVDKLNDAHVKVEVVPLETKMNTFFSILISWFPTILFIGIWVFFMRGMNGGKGGAFGFGKSKAKMLSDKGPKITFKDVAGIDEAKDELQEIVDFLRDPGKFQRLGGKIPKGCLLIGPPGTGKTLLAKAIAGEANVPFFSISGSDFVEMFVGVGASRVRDMFQQGKENAPCIIFIDEIDAVGRSRGVGIGGGNDEREQTLNQMLVEMDGFADNEGVVIIAATNRPDVLDKALLRPGRFDRQITVWRPDINGREKILKVHMSKIKHVDDIDIRQIARGTPGFSGAELANLVNEAALLAARKSKSKVDLGDLESAKDKVMMGVERRSMVMTDDQKRLTAYHEGGHALVSIHIPASDPIHKATIIPRGGALGMVMRLPENDRLSITFEQMKADIAVAMAGRVAEELIFGREKVTSGASSDISYASAFARKMVMEWGLSSKVGHILHSGTPGDVYRDTPTPRSDNTSDVIDSEVKSFVEDGYQQAKKILTEHIDDLHKLAEALIKYETLSGSQITDLLAGKEIVDSDVAPSKKTTTKSSGD
jgi:cell division protease FtsH